MLFADIFHTSTEHIDALKQRLYRMMSVTVVGMCACKLLRATPNTVMIGLILSLFSLFIPDDET